MTRKELEKEAQRAFDNKDLWYKVNVKESVFKDGYIAGAEPREKRIAELEQQLKEKETVDDLWQVFKSLPGVPEPLLIIDAYKRNGQGEKEYVRRNQFCLFEGSQKECQNFVERWKKENNFIKESE